MSRETWSGWMTWTPAGDRDVPVDVRPGDEIEADLIVRPHWMEWCRGTGRPAFYTAFRFTVTTGVAWMPMLPPGAATTHFVLRYRVRLDGTGSGPHRAEEVSA